MRKSLIVSAFLAVSTLFVGAASAQDRGAERPSLQNIRSGRNVDMAERTAHKIRESRERVTREVVRTERPARLDRARPKGDMVDSKGPSSRVVERTGRGEATSSRGADALKGKVRARGDVENGGSSKRTFTLANDRKGYKEHSGPRTIVDVMKRRELFKFLGATGVKINCKQTGTCTESPI